MLTILVQCLSNWFLHAMWQRHLRFIPGDGATPWNFAEETRMLETMVSTLASQPTPFVCAERGDVPVVLGCHDAVVPVSCPGSDSVLYDVRLVLLQASRGALCTARRKGHEEEKEKSG